MPNEKVEGAMVLPASTNDKVWRWSKERFLKEKEAGNIEFKRSNGVLLNSDGTQLHGMCILKFGCQIDKMKVQLLLI